MVLDRRQLRPKSIPLGSDEAYRQGGQIVALHSASAESMNPLKKLFQEGRRREFLTLSDAGHEPVVAKFLTLAIERLGDAVTEHDENVAGVELERFLLERTVTKRPDDEATSLEPA